MQQGAIPLLLYVDMYDAIMSWHYNYSSYVSIEICQEKKLYANDTRKVALQQRRTLNQFLGISRFNNGIHALSKICSLIYCKRRRIGAGVLLNFACASIIIIILMSIIYWYRGITERPTTQDESLDNKNLANSDKIPIIICYSYSTGAGDLWQ